MEFALLPNSKVVCLKKGITSPIKIERPLAPKVYSVLCSIFIVSHFLRFVNMLSEICLITFREVEKSLPCVKGGGTACCDGGIVTVSYKVKTIPQPPSASAPFTQGSLFYVHLCLVNFPDKHCICGHKSKIRHTSFEIYRIFENCPLGDAPMPSGFWYQ